MAIKVGNKLVLICSTAIGLVYSAGFLITGTQSSAESRNPLSHSYVASQQLDIKRNSDQQNDNTSDSQSNNSNQSSSVQTTAPSHQGKYRDGTYHGQGSNQIGSVEVAVSIKNSKITDVQITNCTTSYPQSEIDGLPSQVVERQSANVDFVSGATLSSEDFQTAIQDALQQAQNA